jgi:anti-anti-sigma factor
MMDFIAENLKNNICLISVNINRATLEEAEEFKSLLFEKILRDIQKIIIDLSQCEFIDSTFLGSLVVSLKKATSKGGDLRLIGFQPGVETMFELTRMHRVFESFKTKEEAVNSYSL